MNILKKLSFTADMIPIVAVLFLVQFVYGAYLISFYSSFAVDQLHLSVAIIGVSLTIHYITDNVAKNVIGYLLDHFSPRLVVNIGLVISLLGLFIVKYAVYPWILILSAAIYGVGISPIWIVCLSRVSEENRAAQMGFLYMIWMVGLGLGSVIINFVMDKSVALAFWVMIFVWLGAWLLSLLITHVQKRHVNVISFKKQFKMLWKRLRTMRPLLPGMILQTSAASMLVPILPTFAVDKLGLTHSQYSYVLLTGGIFAVAGLIPFGKLSDVIGKKWFLVIGFITFGIGLGLLAWNTSLSTIFILAAIIGASYSAVLPSWNALLSEQVPHDQAGLGWGFFSSIEGIGVMVGPVLGGVIGDAFGIKITVIVSACLLALIGLFYLIYPFSKLRNIND